jgi:hypothetical protein
MHSRLVKSIYRANGIPARQTYGAGYDDKSFDKKYAEWQE